MFINEDEMIHKALGNNGWMIYKKGAQSNAVKRVSFKNESVIGLTHQVW